jgi:molecular chaperone Hsp33
MPDEQVTGLLKTPGLRVLVAKTGRLCRRARDIHACHPASAALLAQGLTAGILMASLQKERARVNLQLECDGPVRGMFVDANSDGTVRGYVKNALVEFVGSSRAFEWRPVLGNSGYLSVLRDRGEGEHYRSSVELQAFDFAQDLRRFFEVSEQLRTSVWLDQIPAAGELLHEVWGMFLQPLPEADMQAFEAQTARLSSQAGFATLVRANASVTAEQMVSLLFPEEPVAVMAKRAVSYQCTCSKERVLQALAAIGRQELEDILVKEGRAEMTCEFCRTQYEISGQEIRTLLGGGAQA